MLAGPFGDAVITMKAERDIWLPKGVSIDPSSAKPFYTFILKVASRCNIDCDYCYMYHGPDQSWRTRPKFMSEEVLHQAAFRINEHVKSHGLSEVAIALHGGEPLMLGHKRFKRYIEQLRDRIDCGIRFGIQTNGILIDEKFLDIFVEENVNVGISLDGTLTHNNRHRHRHDGSSSYAQVMSGITLMQSREEWLERLSGFLAVIDIKNDPVEVLNAFVELRASSFDILLPHMNHDEPPPRPRGPEGDIVYGRWLAEMFEAWYHGHPDIRISMFEDLMALALGGRSYSEALAATCVDLIIVEADGAIEAVDTLKMVGEFATSLSMNVANQSFDEAAQHPAIYSRMIGFEALCTTCRSCSFLRQCGGGYIPNRFSKKAGFLNPSVYCSDLQFLIRHVERTVERETSAVIPA